TAHLLRTAFFPDVYILVGAIAVVAGVIAELVSVLSLLSSNAVDLGYGETAAAKRHGFCKRTVGFIPLKLHGTDYIEDGGRRCLTIYEAQRRRRFCAVDCKVPAGRRMKFSGCNRLAIRISSSMASQ